MKKATRFLSKIQSLLSVLVLILVTGENSSRLFVLCFVLKSRVCWLITLRITEEKLCVNLCSV